MLPSDSNRHLPAKSPMDPWEWPTEPWHRLHADFAEIEGRNLLVICDARTKWVEAHSTSKLTSAAAIERFWRCFASEGLCKILVTDNGPCFTSSEFAAFARSNGIVHRMVNPHSQSSNGLAERAVGIVKTGMKKMGEGSFDTRLSRVLFRYRITPQSTTGVAPCVALRKRQLRSRLDSLRPAV